jgi:hypothetical protein
MKVLKTEISCVLPDGISWKNTTLTSLLATIHQCLLQYFFVVLRHFLSDWTIKQGWQTRPALGVAL